MAIPKMKLSGSHANGWTIRHCGGLEYAMSRTRKDGTRDVKVGKEAYIAKQFKSVARLVYSN